jgi:uncharacterized protein YcsI (UPF0317 family)
MSMRLRSRLQSLERGVVSVHGCPACRQRRDRIALVDITQHPDDSVTYAADAPPVCAACGQVPELVVEVVAAVIDGPTTACDSAP